MVDCAGVAGEQVRLLISDTDLDDPLFTDPQISTFLALENGSVRLAAAAALDVIATSEALTSKAIRTQDLSTDGPKVAAALRDHAAALRAQATASGETDGPGVGFAVIEFAQTVPSPGPELT
jgi:hypothetical protein